MHARLEADVAVIGGGPAGIAAAVRAAERGARVVMLDEGERPGGQIWRHRATAPAAARRWLAALSLLESNGRITRLARTAVVDIAPGDLHALHAQGAAGMVSVLVPALVLATGARELLLPFAGWTLPGVVGAGGAQALLKSGLDVRGRVTVVAGSGPLLLPVAAALAQAGARVIEVAEQAPAARVLRFASRLWNTPARLAQAAVCRARFAGARYRTGTWVRRALGTVSVDGVVLTEGRRTRTLRCDLLCVGYGLVPAGELAVLAGCRQIDGFTDVDPRQHTSVPGVYAAGELTAIGGVEAAVVEGAIAGLSAAGQIVAGAPTGLRRLERARARHRAFAARLATAFALRDELRRSVENDTTVCRCEDVAHERLAACSSGREARVHARAGMGPCQARVCGPAMQYLYGWEPQSVRPPAQPVTIAGLMDITAEQGAAAYAAQRLAGRIPGDHDAVHRRR
jgi:D-hydroxyproline dehydrogenase subunit alpha